MIDPVSVTSIEKLMPTAECPTIPMQEFASRRQALMSRVPSDSLILIPSAQERLRNGADNMQEFRQNSDFLYLTGLNEPEAVLVLAPGRADGEAVLFNRTRNPDAEIWTGKRAGQAGACSKLLMDQAFPIENFAEQLGEFMQGRSAVYYPVARNDAFDALVLKTFSELQARVRRGISAPEALINIEKHLHQLRVVKSPAELEVMQTVNNISMNAHLLAMQRCQPGIYEYQLEAIFREQCWSAGCRSMAYSPIVGAGENSCILHYIDNNKKIADGDLVLIDAGGELQGYAADITRTFPANGRFTEEQKIIYNIVLNAQLAALAIVKPGLAWNELQAVTAKSITQGLVDAGILSGDVGALVAEKAYQKFYMHLSGHWLGLDVHDAGAYCVQDKWAVLEPGMVFTIEPGIYIGENTPGVDPRWWNIGVRIEDNILVTETGMRNLTENLPKTVEAIEAAMNNG